MRPGGGCVAIYAWGGRVTVPQIIGVVGPSGVGKDTVMAALARARPGIRLVRRVITRDVDAGGEAFTSVSPTEFAQMQAAEEFALHWQAHGLSYGIPIIEILPRNADEVLLVNLSRSVLDQARARFGGFRILSLTASPEALARRLSGRGRESAAEIMQRLSRADYARPVGSDVLEIANNETLKDTVSAVLGALYPVRA